MNKFSMKSGMSLPKEGEFIRSNQDNKILKPLQVKGGFFDIVDKDAVLWVDCDGIPFKCASSVEEDFIKVSLIKPESGIENSLTFTGEKEFKNKTEFKGRTQGDAIGTGSFLYDLNLKREVAGITTFKLSDFYLVPDKRLKFEKGATVDGNKLENSFEVCKYYIDKWLDACLIQTQLKRLKLVIGAGDTHRHKVLVPHQYKSDRSSARPILLTEARGYLKEKYDVFVAPPSFEADEIVDAVAAIAYDNYKQGKCKVKVVKAANDKDSRSKRGINFDWQKSFHFQNPQCWLIPDFKDGVGYIEMVKGEVKGGGSVFFAYQVLVGDLADEYSPRKYLPKDFVHYGKGYGDESFYKDFANFKTSKEVWQKVVDKYLEWFPQGLQYIAWDGTEVDEDTLSYLQKHYQLAYMLEGRDDKSTVKDFLDSFDVDYSSLIDNNKLTPPVKTFVGDENNIKEVSAIIESILKEDFVGIKSLKKVDISERIDQIKEKLSSINFDSHYVMKQFEKESKNV